MRPPAVAVLEPLAALDRDGDVALATLTAEEMTAIGADDGAVIRPMRQAAWLRAWPESAQPAILATALRGLAARGLVRQPDDDELARGELTGNVGLEALGDLRLILSVRRAATSVAVVATAQQHVILYAFQDGRGRTFLEERPTPAELHAFRLRTPASAAAAVVALADPGRRTRPGSPDAGPPDRALLQRLPRPDTIPPGVTRIAARHAGPAGNRRESLVVVVEPGLTWMAQDAGRGETAFPVSQDGLLRRIEAVLAPPD